MRKHRKAPTMNVVERMRQRRKARQAERPVRQALPAGTARAPSSAALLKRKPAPKPIPAPQEGAWSTAWRIAGALGTTPAELAVKLEVPYDAIAEMFKGTSGQSAIAHGHPAWTALARLVDEQIGLLMGVRAELEGKRELDAKRLRQRMERAKL